MDPLLPAMARVPLAGTTWIPGVSEEQTLAKIERMLEAARWSPSCANRQPWRFVVVGADAPSRAAVDRLLEKEKALGANLRFEDIIDEVAGVYPKIMLDGAMEAGAWSCGMVAGLIHDIPTVKELIDRIMVEAEAIIAQRLARFAAAMSSV